MQFKHIPFLFINMSSTLDYLVNKHVSVCFSVNGSVKSGDLVTHACIQNVTMNQNADCTYYLFINFTIGFELQREGYYQIRISNVYHSKV